MGITDSVGVSQCCFVPRAEGPQQIFSNRRLGLTPRVGKLPQSKLDLILAALESCLAISRGRLMQACSGSGGIYNPASKCPIFSCLVRR